MKAEARFFFLAISSAVPVGFQRSNFLRPVLPRKLSTYSRRVELGSAVGSSGVSAGMFCRVNQLSTDLRNSWKSSYCSVVFQSKDGVTSDIDGWFGSSFASAAVRAAIGSAGSGGGMAEGVPEERIEATEGNNPSESCHVAYLHNRWADFNEILTQYPWGGVDPIFTTRGACQHHDVMVAPPTVSPVSL